MLERPSISVRQVLDTARDHLAHHRGQAIVYLRLKGVEPPLYVGFSQCVCSRLLHHGDSAEARGVGWGLGHASNYARGPVWPLLSDSPEGGASPSS